MFYQNFENFAKIFWEFYPISNLMWQFQCCKFRKKIFNTSKVTIFILTNLLHWVDRANASRLNIANSAKIISIVQLGSDMIANRSAFFVMTHTQKHHFFKKSQFLFRS